MKIAMVQTISPELERKLPDETFDVNVLRRKLVTELAKYRLTAKKEAEAYAGGDHSVRTYSSLSDRHRNIIKAFELHIESAMSFGTGPELWDGGRDNMVYSLVNNETHYYVWDPPSDEYLYVGPFANVAFTMLSRRFNMIPLHIRMKHADRFYDCF